MRAAAAEAEALDSLEGKLSELRLGPLAPFFEAEGPATRLSAGSRLDDLIDGTRHLVLPCVPTTEFAKGSLDLGCLEACSIYTIFSRAEHGGVPYRLADLAADLTAGSLDRRTIDAGVERAILGFAAASMQLPAVPELVLVHGRDAAQYLILEGNKRLTGAHLAGSRRPARMPATLGSSSLSWAGLLALYRMRPAV